MTQNNSKNHETNQQSLKVKTNVKAGRPGGGGGSSGGSGSSGSGGTGGTN